MSGGRFALQFSALQLHAELINGSNGLTDLRMNTYRAPRRPTQRRVYLLGL